MLTFVDDGPPKKKSKKSRRKEYSDVEIVDGDSMESTTPSASIKPITLKIKFGNEVISKSTPGDQVSVDTSSLKSKQVIGYGCGYGRGYW